MKLDPEKLRYQTALLLALSLATLATLCAGCSRQTYRRWADRDAYRLVKSRQTDPSWVLPDRTVEPNPRSRLADVYDPDCEPLPPDDPAAACYMRKPYHSKKSVRYWDGLGRADAIDSQRWLEYLPYNEDGEVLLDKQMAVDIALLNNREFQTRVERLYTSALSLSANRFEYDLNWFGGSSTSFDATDDGFDAERNLSHSNRTGFTRNLATGGQFAVNLLNSFTWQLGGSGNSNFSAGNMAFSLTQPLLRGAFRYVRTESLTQAERNLLYDVRDFARFRRQFYLQRVSQFLNVLNQAQRVKINEENLRNLELNLDEHNVLFQNETVSQIDVDQVYQDYQSGRVSVIGSRQALQGALDNLKFDLGLPARVPIKLDESILQPFILNSPEIEELRDEAEALEQAVLQYLPPEEAPTELLDEMTEKIKSYSTEVEKLKPQVDKELDKWIEKLGKNAPGENASKDEKDDFEQESELAEQIKGFLEELNTQVEEAKKPEPAADSTQPPVVREQDGKADDQDTNEDPNVIGFEPDDTEAIKQWRRIQFRIAKLGGLKDRISTLYFTQRLIRLFLIEIKPLEVEEQTAVEIALQRRLDLMNSRAAVVDAYRGVEIAADRLQSDLDVSASADLRTDPTKNNAFRFDGDENQYNVGVQFDGPLNRLNERNAYRVAQLAYQQQRRAYMADEDSIVNSVRANIRQLRTERFNFQIARKQLFTATRQVDETQFSLREGEGNSSSTQNLLAALARLRDSKNGLINNWIQYETSRIELFVDLELLMLDNNGRWINDRENFDDYIPSGRPGFDDTPDSDSDAVSGSDDGTGNPTGSREPTSTIEQPQPAIDQSQPAIEAPLSSAPAPRSGSWIRNLLGRN